jgi:hypothetical protein
MLAASMINRVGGQELLKSGKPWINLHKALWAVAAAPRRRFEVRFRSRELRPWLKVGDHS